MIEFSDININDKPIFDAYLKKLNPNASELTFTNFFMWRNYYNFRYTVIRDLLCIIAVPQETGPFAFIPAGAFLGDALQEAVSRLKEYFASKGWNLEFKRVEEEKLQLFESIVTSSQDIIFDRDSSDYVYSSEDLINLKGKKYDGKRNHINKFKKLYQFEYIPLGQEHLDQCEKIMTKWCAERDCETHRGFYCEKLANTELLKNYGKMGCRGALIKVDGEPEAFTVGEMLNSETAVIHIEKANGNVNGLYTFINQQFCENEWSEALFVNREQDLGIEGLRKAKLSYHPAKMVNKYTVKII
ncbi:MAG: phosphatidylglycerol lysyltransferase domain-containing protein [Clostridia bacterium]|nr:phosphatidylglycerol lysyltransferase domain-containing protein [Clostridia bacterium]